MLGPGFVLTSKTKKSSSGKVMAKAMRYLDDDSVALVAREMAKELGDLVKASEEPYKHKGPYTNNLVNKSNNIPLQLLKKGKHSLRLKMVGHVSSALDLPEQAKARPFEFAPEGMFRPDQVEIE